MIFIPAALEASNRKADSLLAVGLSKPTDTLKVKMLVEASKLYAAKDLSKSLSTAQQAEQLAAGLAFPNIHAYAMFQLGNALMEQGILDKATETYYATLQILKATNNVKVMGYLYSNLGAIKLYVNDFEAAKVQFLNVLDIYNRIDPTQKDLAIMQRLPVTLNNLGVVYQSLQKYDSAIYYYRQGIQLTEEPDSDQQIKGKLLNNLASLHLLLGDADSAFKPLQQALKLQQAQADMAGIASSYNLISQYYSASKDFKTAIRYANDGMKISRQLGSINLIANASENLFKCYQHSGMADSALKYHVVFKQFSDSLNRENALKELTRIEMTAHFEEQQMVRQIAIEKYQYRLYFILVLLGLLVVTLVLFYLLSQSRLRRLRLQKSYAELEKTNLRNELEIKNKELATNVMYLIRKNELIGQIAAELLEKSMHFKKENQQIIHRVIHDLEKVQDEAIWADFEIRFQQVHNNFYQTLLQIAPDITANERRLCAFLKLQMTTKEIATITGQSPRSIEVARTRLRKKLQLTNTETSLIEFLMTI